MPQKVTTQDIDALRTAIDKSSLEGLSPAQLGMLNGLMEMPAQKKIEIPPITMSGGIDSMQVEVDPKDLAHDPSLTEYQAADKMMGKKREAAPPMSPDLGARQRPMPPAELGAEIPPEAMEQVKRSYELPDVKYARQGLGALAASPDSVDPSTRDSMAASLSDLAPTTKKVLTRVLDNMRPLVKE